MVMHKSVPDDVAAIDSHCPVVVLKYLFESRPDDQSDKQELIEAF